MTLLDDAQAEIVQAEEHVTKTEVRTKLDSITTSIQEIEDAAAGERTDGDIALADSEVVGAPPRDETLQQVEENLLDLAEATDDADVREHLSNARLHVEKYRTGTETV